MMAKQTASEENPEAEEATGVRAARELIETGSDIMGAVAGTAIGIVGGQQELFFEAEIGAVATPGLVNVGREIQQRVLGPREHVRMDAVAAYAVMATKPLLD